MQGLVPRTLLYQLIAADAPLAIWKFTIVSGSPVPSNCRYKLDVANTREPVPVSSEITPRSSADVVAAAGLVVPLTCGY
jgi:hypothetical protein